MAKNKVEVDVKVDDKGTTRKVGLGAKKAAQGLDEAAKGAHSADRQLKGAAQASSNTTKNFSKMSQGITGGLVPAYATLAANLFALSAAFNFLKKAADVRNLRESQIQFTETTGVAMGMLTTNLREAADGMLSFQAAAQASAIGVAKGFSPSQMESIAQGARKVSTALGRDFEDAFDRLVRGASKAEPELLDELGITLRLANATDKYAQSIGKNVKDLTEYERSQAVLKETMGQLEKQFGEVIPKTNEFTKLGKTFGDIVDKVSAKALPAIESFVGFINNNMESAVAIVALFAGSILQSAVNFGALEEKALSFSASMEASQLKKQANLQALKESQQTTLLGKGRVAQATGTRAQAAMQGIDTGRSKVGRQIAASGTAGLNANQRKAALRALAKAEQQIIGTNLNVQTGMYKNASAKQLAIIKQGLMGSEAAATKTTKGMTAAFMRFFVSTEVRARQFGVAMGAIFQGVGVAAGMAGRAMSLMMGAFMWVGLAVMAFQAVKGFIDKANEGKPKIHDFAEETKALGEHMETVTESVDAATKAIERQETAANRSRIALNAITTIDFAGQMDKINLVSGLEKSQKELADYKKQLAELPKALTEQENLAAELAAPFPTKVPDMSRAIQRSSLTGTQDKLIGRRNEKREKFKFTGDVEKKVGPDLFTFAPLIDAKLTDEQLAYNQSIVDLQNKVTAYNNSAEERTKIEEAIKIATTNVQTAEKLRADGLKKLSEEALRLGDVTLANMVAAGDYNAALERQEKLQRFLANDKAFTSALNAAKDITSMSSTAGYNYLNSLLAQANAQVDLADEINKGGKSTIAMTDAQKALNEAFKKAGIEDVPAYLAGLKAIKDKEEELRAKRSTNKIAEINNMTEISGLRKEAAAEAIKVEDARITMEEKREALKRARETEKLRGQNVDEEANRVAAVAAQQAFDQAEAKHKNVKKTTEDGFKVMAAASAAFETSLISGLQGIFDGTKSVKDAFKDMAKSTISAIMQVTVKMLALKMIENSFLGGFFGKDGGLAMTGPPSTGGRGYRTGGIPKGSQRGYQATLHGTEAVVPLPNGRSIPVEMKGRGGMGGDTNNVTINVTNTGAQGNQGPQANAESNDAALGRVLQLAVTEELKKQKRPGGLLSPYGAD